MPTHPAPNKIIPGLPLLAPAVQAPLKHGLHPENWVSVLFSNLGDSPLSSDSPLQPRSLMGKGSQWLLRLAWSQEIVENSLSRTSWLSVWKARFLRTLVLMDRTWESGGGRQEDTGREKRGESCYKQQRAVYEAQGQDSVLEVSLRK